jgi:hypothetical protein
VLSRSPKLGSDQHPTRSNLAYLRAIFPELDDGVRPAVGGSPVRALEVFQVVARRRHRGKPGPDRHSQQAELHLVKIKRHPEAPHVVERDAKFLVLQELRLSRLDLSPSAGAGASRGIVVRKPVRAAGSDVSTFATTSVRAGSRGRSVSVHSCAFV